jgi:hypothetical protein
MCSILSALYTVFYNYCACAVRLYCIILIDLLTILFKDVETISAIASLYVP